MNPKLASIGNEMLGVEATLEPVAILFAALSPLSNWSNIRFTSVCKNND